MPIVRRSAAATFPALATAALTAAGTAAVVVALIVGSGCGVGQRPSLGMPAETASTPTNLAPVNIASVDEVLSVLDAVGATPFTATYAVRSPADPTTTVTAIVSNQPAGPGGDAKTSVTVGDVRFLKGPGAQTCNLATRTCEAGLQSQRVTNIVPAGVDFYGPAVSRQIRISATRRRGDPVARLQPIAGSEARCVVIPIGLGEETYCVVPSGQLAYVKRADVLIELISARSDVDAELFATP